MLYHDRVTSKYLKYLTSGSAAKKLIQSTYIKWYTFPSLTLPQLVWMGESISSFHLTYDILGERPHTYAHKQRVTHTHTFRERTTHADSHWAIHTHTHTLRHSNTHTSTPTQTDRQTNKHRTTPHTHKQTHKHRDTGSEPHAHLITQGYNTDTDT